jgi:hypothetical protein
MNLGDLVARHGFIACPSLDDFLSPNTLFSPYVSFLSSFFCAYLADDLTNQMAIRLSLSMNPIDTSPQSTFAEIFTFIQATETWLGATAEFNEFLDLLSAKQDCHLKYFTPNAVHLIHNIVRNAIIARFPEFASSNQGDAIFAQVVQLSHESPDDERLQELIASLEFPLSLLREAAILECRCAFWCTARSERIDALGRALQCEVAEVAFDADGLAMINRKNGEWTKGQADPIVLEVQPDIQVLLTATMYVDMRWDVPFSAVETLPFNTLNGRVMNVKCMVHCFERVNFFEDEELQLLELPYSGGDMAMVFLLYKEQKLDQVDFDVFENLIGKFIETTVYVQIPRFDVEFGPKSMRPTLPVEYKGELGDVIHRYSLGNYDSGTLPTDKAGNGKLPDCGTRFIADHSFLFYFRDVGSSAIIMMGSITNPIAVDLTPRSAVPVGGADDAMIYVTEAMSENQSLWNQIENIGMAAPPRAEIEIPVAVTDESDLWDFIDEDGRIKRATQEELDDFFGVKTPQLVTYPKYLPWPDVRLKPPHPRVVYEPITEGIELPPMDVQLPPLQAPVVVPAEVVKTKEQKRSNSAAAKALPKIVRPVGKNVHQGFLRLTRRK